VVDRPTHANTRHRNFSEEGGALLSSVGGAGDRPLARRKQPSLAEPYVECESRGARVAGRVYIEAIAEIQAGEAQFIT
jgi:hypothetical protein